MRWCDKIEKCPIMVVKYDVSEKKNPTYDLDAFKATCSDSNTLPITKTAFATAQALGFDRTEVVATIQTMERTHFYKSMTSQADYRIWQDVYHVPSEMGLLYVKFTGSEVTRFLLLSFKEKDYD
jgi:motility quorum-sensing regulator / GCU-specific mRNA interferase toxin